MISGGKVTICQKNLAQDMKDVQSRYSKYILDCPWNLEIF